MDDNSRRRRHNEPPMHPSSNPRYPQQTLHDPSQQQQQQQQRRSYGQQPTDRFRPSPLNAPTTATGRGMGGSAGYGTTGYYQDTGTTGFPSTGMPQGAMGYHQPGAEYGQAGDTRQSQGFSASTYNPTAMMYNVQGGGGAQNPAAAAAAVYDTTSQQFSSRPPAAAMQMMPPDVGASYFPNEPTNATGAASGMQPQAAPSTQALYQPSGLSNYSGGIASMGGMAAAAAQPPPPAAAGPPDVSMEEQESSASTGLEEAWATYQTELRGVFRNVQDGVLAAASESLLNLSDWLLSHVSDLGLNTDNQSLHNDRIKLWNDFNHAWLALLQRQKDMMESGAQLQRSQTLVSQENLEKMGKELVRLCDGVERHGLVDYQYGVWEERIIDILGDCLDLYDPQDDAEGGHSSHAA